MKRLIVLFLFIGLITMSAPNYVWCDSAVTENNEIVINGCQTGVVDRVHNGYWIHTLINGCFSTAKNHGDFLSCVAKLTKELKNAEKLSRREIRAIQKCAAKKPTVILYNGLIYTMEDDPFVTEAVFIKGNKIRAIGTNQKILKLAKKNTVRIDLDGRAVFPGFIDPHTHLFNEYHSQNITLDEAQQLALESGITSVANMYTDKYWLDDIMQYARNGNMRIRLYLYLNYNHSCGEVFGTWYEKYTPRVQHAP